MLSNGNGECKISDEAVFFKTVSHKMHGYYMEAKDELKSYQRNEFLIFRIYENIEQSIQTLETLKLEGYKDAKTFHEREDSIANMLWVLSMIIENLKDFTGFEFPYFHQLLGLTYSPKVLNNLANLALGVWAHFKSDTQTFSGCLKSCFVL